MKKTLLATLIAALFCQSIYAENLPSKGKFDDRIRLVDYNEHDVFKVVTYYGVATHILFSDDEIIEDREIGDGKAWAIRHRKNYLFLQPIEKNADSNLTVITNKRVYQFALYVETANEKDTKAWAKGSLVYSLRFRYPQEEAKQKQEAVQVEEKKKTAAEIKQNLELNNQNDEGQNFDYWVSGSKTISPTSARDNGRFIYLTFSGNKDMPSVHEVNEKGEESLIKTTVTGNTIVVEKLVRHLILRKGDIAACVINKSFDANDEVDNTSGTVSKSVQRVLKGAK